LHDRVAFAGIRVAYQPVKRLLVELDVALLYHGQQSLIQHLQDGLAVLLETFADVSLTVAAVNVFLAVLQRQDVYLHTRGRQLLFITN